MMKAKNEWPQPPVVPIGVVPVTIRVNDFLGRFGVARLHLTGTALLITMPPFSRGSV
jgi:hypothetical protein